MSKQKQIEIKRLGAYLQIACPYDEELINEIKALPWKERKWEDSCWKVVESSIEQKKDEETNLEYIRRIATHCAQKRGWVVADLTAISIEQVQQEQQATTIAQREEHVQAFLSVLPKLPIGILRLVRWGNDSIKLQLNSYLGESETGYQLFLELYHASKSAYRPSLYASFDLKTTVGFVFEVAADERIIKVLLPNRVKFLKNIELNCIRLFDDGVAHFTDTSGTLWVGMDYKKVDMSSRDFDAKSWEVAATHKGVYWVAEAEKYIRYWLAEPQYTSVYAGGAFAVAFPQRSHVAHHLQTLHLQEWFVTWVTNMIAIKTVEPDSRFHKSLWKEYNWKHPADTLLTHLKQAEDLLLMLGWSVGDLREHQLLVNQLKMSSASSAREQARTNAKELALGLLEAKTKDEIIKLAQNYSIPIKKSAAKKELVFTLNDNQELCEALIGFKDTEAPEV